VKPRGSAASAAAIRSNSRSSSARSAEVVQLPAVQVLVEGAREGDAAVRRGLGGRPQPRQLVDGPLVEEAPVVAGEEPRLQHLVAQVLEDHEPLVLLEGQDGRHPHADGGEVALHVDEGVDGRAAALGHLLRPRARRHDHHHVRGREGADAPVAAHRGVAGEARHRQVGGVAARGPGHRGADAGGGGGEVLDHAGSV
jgi:hypothetical protein